MAKAGGGAGRASGRGSNSISQSSMDALEDKVTSSQDYGLFGRYASKWLSGSDYKSRDIAFGLAKQNSELHSYLLHKRFGLALPKSVTLYRVGNLGDRGQVSSFFSTRKSAQAYQRRMGVDRVDAYRASVWDVVPTGSGSGEVWGAL